MQVFSWIQLVKRSRLEPATRHVLHVLSTYMNADGEGAFPSYETIAEDTGLTRKTVIGHIAKAVDAGLLLKEERHRTNGANSTNHYLACFPKNVEMRRSSRCLPTPGECQERPWHGVASDPSVPLTYPSEQKTTPYNPPRGDVEDISSLFPQPTLLAPQEPPDQPSAIPKKQTKLELQQGIWFHEFWQNFWKKRDVRNAEKAFRRHVRSQADFDQLMAGFQRDRAMMLAREDAHRKMAQGWINSLVWREEVEPVEEAEDDFTRERRLYFERLQRQQGGSAA